MYIFRSWHESERASELSMRLLEIHDLDRTVSPRMRMQVVRGRFPEMTIQHVGTRRDVVSRIFLVGDLA